MRWRIEHAEKLEDGSLRLVLRSEEVEIILPMKDVRSAKGRLLPLGQLQAAIQQALKGKVRAGGK